MRVVILKEFVKKHFPVTTVMDYAIEVEKITTSKVTWTTYLDSRDTTSPRGKTPPPPLPLFPDHDQAPRFF